MIPCSKGLPRVRLAQESPLALLAYASFSNSFLGHVRPTSLVLIFTSDGSFRPNLSNEPWPTFGLFRRGVLFLRSGIRRLRLFVYCYQQSGVPILCLIVTFLI